MSLPPLPEGYALRQPEAAPETSLPPLPEGYALRQKPATDTSVEPIGQADEQSLGGILGEVGDFRRQVAAAAVDSFAGDAAAIGYLADSESALGVGRNLQKTANSIRDELSPENKAAAAKEWVKTTDNGYEVGEAWSDPRAWSGLTASAIGSLGAIIAGGGLTKLGAKVGLKGAAKALGKNIDLSKGTQLERRISQGSYMLNEGAMMGGSAGMDVETAVLEMPQEVLGNSPIYIETRDEMIANGVPKNEIEDQTRKAVARTLAVDATKGAGLTGMLLGAPASKWLDDTLSRRVSGTMVENATRGIVTEGLTEAGQGASQQLITNYQIQQADRSKNVMDNVLNAAVSEGLGGGIAAGGLGAIRGTNPQNNATTPGVEDINFEEVANNLFDGPVDLTTFEEPAGNLSAPQPAPDFVTTPDGAAAQSQSTVDAYYDILDEQNQQTQGPDLIGVINEPQAQQSPDFIGNQDGLVATPQQQSQLDAGFNATTPLIENQNIIYGEGPVKQPARNDGMQGEFPQGYNVDTYSDAEFKPLSEINYTQQYQIAETGETVEVSERADRLFSRMDKRRNVLTKLLECVS